MKSFKKIKVSLGDIRQKWNNARLNKATVFWIVLGTVILTIYIGFSKAGWVTGSTATRMATSNSKDAVIERLASICVAQAKQDPLGEQKLAELNELATTTKRTNYIKEQAWATMPGETTTDNDVVAECARALKLLEN